MGEPLTLEEQFELRSELEELMQIGRITRTDALYDASASAQTSEASDQAVLNPIDVGAIVDVN